MRISDHAPLSLMGCLADFLVRSLCNPIKQFGLLRAEIKEIKTGAEMGSNLKHHSLYVCVASPAHEEDEDVIKDLN